MGQPKTYDATLKLGATTETDDPESEERPTGATAVELDQVRAVLPAFIGEIAQAPPAYSALKIGGRRAADRVRAGQTVVMQARTVRVYAIELLDYAWPLLRLRIDCGRGTYIRAIARDLGAALGAGGYLTELRRTRIGPYDVGNAVNLRDPPDADRLLAALLPVDPKGV
jgi:tRNA pseudouridine55 synthase